MSNSGAPHPSGNHCADALSVLDELLARPADELPPDQVYNAMAEASRCLVKLRDGLIARKRSGDDGGAATLEHVNTALSVTYGAEFPLVGVRRKRVETMRDQLRKVLTEAKDRA
ncbi:hypothetical protein [Azospirillum sp. TSO35-2]|uniref:hypothetical protein n=1 Tax=Azospirillum sp. TSO35-2 TaxID=716796 RepID=UPI000D613AE7|nr:hypothetical protein [Azospirillum sp. TSO35-2]PWC35961.1 hypothetical protein TSO352_12225 [Azospirillum sp. TSO35-2]